MFDLGFDRLFGIRIIKDIYCTERKSRQVRRSWKERLFKYPFKFWIKYKTEDYDSPAMYMTKDMVICHPSLYDEVRKIIETRIKP